MSSEETEELQLENVAGIFIVLAVAILLGAAACGVDRLLQWKWKQMKQKVNIRDVL